VERFFFTLVLADCGSDLFGPLRQMNAWARHFAPWPTLRLLDGWYRIKSRARIGSSREDKVMKIEIEYCGQ